MPCQCSLIEIYIGNSGVDFAHCEDVFFKKAAETFSVHHPYDCDIPPIPGHTAFRGRVSLHFLLETEAISAYIKNIWRKVLLVYFSSLCEK